MSGTKAPPGGPAGVNPPAPSQPRFEILGPQRAWYADRQLDLGPGKQRAVLAVLLLAAGRPVPTGQIVEAVWPDEPPANGPNVVQKYVAGLRRVLEPDRSPRTPGQVLSLTDAGYLLRITPEAVDAVRFERGIHRARQRHAEGRTEEARAELTGALELWQGEPFTGFAGPYFETARHRLVELRAVALETRVELELAAGRHRELVGGLVELVAEFPVRERLRHQLMLVLYRSGRQAEALAAYRDFGDLLREEYGIEPGEALQELHRRILRSDPTILPVPAPGVEPPPAPPPPVMAPPAPPSSVAAPPAPVSPAPASPVGSPPGPAPAAPASPAPAPPAVVSSGPARPDRSLGRPPPATAPSGFLPPPPPTPAPISPATVPSTFSPPAAPVLPLPAFVHEQERRTESPVWVSHLGTALSVTVVLLSFGMLAWLVMLFYAIRRRSGPLAVATVAYLAAAVFFPIGMELSDIDGPPTFLDGLAIIGLGAAWVGGVGHLILLNRRVSEALRGRPAVPVPQVVDDRRVRREQARYLLYHYPAARQQLHIGRPDLPRTFDDGGLVDINAVGEQVLAGLPGMTAAQARQMAMDRWLRGPFGSMEDLAARCLLPPTLTDSLRDLLVFLPPPPSDQS